MYVTKICARLGVVAMVAFGASACSSIPDWADPGTWLGSDSSPSTFDGGASESPDLASIPDKPNPSSTAQEQQQVAQSLAADRERAKYSSDSLRGGTEPVAVPPPPPSQQVAVAEPPPAATQQTATPEPAPSSTSADNSIDTNPNAATAGADNGVAVAEPPPAATQLPPAAPSPQPQVAMSSPPPQSGMPTAAQINPSDAALGFKPSTAPPLDASIAQFVPGPIVARYNQTAAQAGLSGAPRVASAQPVAAPKARRSSSKAMGGPEMMSGSVVANLDAIQQVPETTTSQAAAYANPQGMPPSSVVFFPGDGTLLSAQAKQQVRAVVEQFRQRGGQGFIRIVGHSSSRTTNMPVEKHLEVIFNKSQDRANSVAKEMIKEGVPANRVLVEAVGDSQPVYYESMPKGEDGNRRAEIFLQS
jgi:outer membrane protein OmpA-like peptidoglycan-associated protein